MLIVVELEVIDGKEAEPIVSSVGTWNSRPFDTNIFRVTNWANHYYALLPGDDPALVSLIIPSPLSPILFPCHFKFNSFHFPCHFQADYKQFFGGVKLDDAMEIVGNESTEPNASVDNPDSSQLELNSQAPALLPNETTEEVGVLATEISPDYEKLDQPAAASVPSDCSEPKVSSQGIICGNVSSEERAVWTCRKSVPNSPAPVDNEPPTVTSRITRVHKPPGNVCCDIEMSPACPEQPTYKVPSASYPSRCQAHKNAGMVKFVTDKRNVGKEKAVAAVAKRSESFQGLASLQTPPSPATVQHFCNEKKCNRVALYVKKDSDDPEETPTLCQQHYEKLRDPKSFYRAPTKKGPVDKPPL